ncbi:MAG: tRNA/rRNA methyltransferase [Spirochaetales bacterium]|jgi:tRNA/rRNA methyltransferase|nr:tRNA/rRNA methyltransferase [Spirochaetales bacterium]
MDLCFILVKPAVAGNIGAAARALKTMGFRRLRLVGACPYRADEALWTAHGSQDILDAAEIFDTLEEAIADRDFVIATTARRRGMKHEYYPPEDLLPLLREKGGKEMRAAVVFGCEESGLSNDDLEVCDCVSSVPLAASYPSLNLAQAVMIYAYALSPLAGVLAAPDGKRGSLFRDFLNDEDLSFKALKKRVTALLAALDEPLQSTEYRLDLAGRRILERLAALKKDDIKLAHSLCSKLEKRLNNR